MRLRAETWALIFLGLALLLWAWAVHAQPLGTLRPGCVPAYATLDPDVYRWTSSQFEVTVIEPDHSQRWHAEYVFASLPCCRVARNAVADLARQVQDRTARIVVGECR